jgi:hypothetical protein
MTMTTTAAETVSRRELQARRRRLLQRAGADWAELERRASDFALTDDQRSIYDTVRSIDWMLSRKP